MAERQASARRVPQEPVALLLAGLLPPPADAAPLPYGRPAAAQEPQEPHEPHDEPAMPPPSPSHQQALETALEALLVVADRPLDLLVLAGAVERPVAAVRQGLHRLRDEYDGADGTRPRGFELREVATGWRLYARPAHDAVVRSLLEIETAGRLSTAALETLAVIAYRQPVTRGQIAAVRAVSVDSVLKTLTARGLVAEVGRSEETGAVQYGTTDELLVALGIRSVSELPPLAPLLEGVEAAHADLR